MFHSSNSRKLLSLAFIATVAGLNTETNSIPPGMVNIPLLSALPEIDPAFPLDEKQMEQSPPKPGFRELWLEQSGWDEAIAEINAKKSAKKYEKIANNLIDQIDKRTLDAKTKIKKAIRTINLYKRAYRKTKIKRYKKLADKYRRSIAILYTRLAERMGVLEEKIHCYNIALNILSNLVKENPKNLNHAKNERNVQYQLAQFHTRLAQNKQDISDKLENLDLSIQYTEKYRLNANTEELKGISENAARTYSERGVVNNKIAITKKNYQDRILFFNDAIEDFENALKIESSKLYEENLQKTYNNRAIVYIDLADQEKDSQKATTLYTQALNDLDRCDVSELEKAKVINNRGIKYKDLSDTSKEYQTKLKMINLAIKDFNDALPKFYLPNFKRNLDISLVQRASLFISHTKEVKSLDEKVKLCDQAENDLKQTRSNHTVKQNNIEVNDDQYSNSRKILQLGIDSIHDSFRNEQQKMNKFVPVNKPAKSQKEKKEEKKENKLKPNLKSNQTKTPLKVIAEETPPTVSTMEQAKSSVFSNWQSTVVVLMGLATGIAVAASRSLFASSQPSPSKVAAQPKDADKSSAIGAYKLCLEMAEREYKELEKLYEETANDPITTMKMETPCEIGSGYIYDQSSLKGFNNRCPLTRKDFNAKNIVQSSYAKHTIELINTVMTQKQQNIQRIKTKIQELEAANNSLKPASATAAAMPLPKNKDTVLDNKWTRANYPFYHSDPNPMTAASVSTHSGIKSNK